MVTDGKYLNGRWITNEIFYEYDRPSSFNIKPQFTLGKKDVTLEDGTVIPSLYKLYMQFEDPTEYQFATTIMGSWDRWMVVSQCSILKPYLNEWRREAELKIRSSALRRLSEMARDETNKHSYSANKLLLERGWKDAEGSPTRRGRPSKEDIRKAASEQVTSNNLIKEAQSLLKDLN